MRFHDDCPEPPKESVDDLMVRARKYIGTRVWDRRLSENEIKTISEACFLVSDMVKALEEAQKCRLCNGTGALYWGLLEREDTCDDCNGTGRDR